MSVFVTNSNNSLKLSSLTSSSLFLNRLDLHNLIFQFFLQKQINDLWFFDRKGMQKDFFKHSNLTSFDQSTQLGNRSPFPKFIIFGSSSSSSSSSSTSKSSVF
eukprot:TRINITY_DN13545_c0_g1_i1.p2 TRINITY_DN13545_c0_g1~~TRINITY_DN13545_c0_g1_i1.p2  ORF type:complete len:103 (-),score=4.40 TRINITY_DN13545_c0_g1_i1:24-332(-)